MTVKYFAKTGICSILWIVVAFVIASSHKIYDFAVEKTDILKGLSLYYLESNQITVIMVFLGVDVAVLLWLQKIIPQQKIIILGVIILVVELIVVVFASYTQPLHYDKTPIWFLSLVILSTMGLIILRWVSYIPVVSSNEELEIKEVG